MKDLFYKILFFLCFFFIIVSQPPVWANEGDMQVQFQDAASAYSRGDYQAAIRGFESLARVGMSAPLLYNLANSYAQDGQSGRAILNYERALRLAPGDSDIRGNLELLRRDKGLFQEEQSYLQRFVSFLGLNQWLGLAATAFVFFVVVLLLPDSVVAKRRTRYGFAASFFFITGVASVGTVGQYQHWQDGVVVASDARLRVSPFDSAASIGTIQEGRMLHPEKSHNNYVLIVDEAGRRGWLSADAFELIAIP
ncbi:tetratricopeptide repeat protein [Methanococcoides sp. SA1]|nr:tetratricopeptide repeat protein [Methanococcoides sp. SA1]